MSLSETRRREVLALLCMSTLSRAWLFGIASIAGIVHGCAPDPSPERAETVPPTTSFEGGTTADDGGGNDAGLNDAALDAASSDGGDAAEGGDAGPPPIVPVAGDGFVSPGGVDGTNDCLTEATPCKTIAFAVSKVQTGKSVWLADGEYGVGATVPAGVAVRGRNQAAIVKAGLSISGSAVSGITFDAQNGLGAGVRATAGTSALSALRFKGNYFNGAGIQVTGAAVVTLEPGGVPNYVVETVATGINNSSNPILRVQDTGSLTVLGGTFDGPGMGHGTTSTTSRDGAAITVEDQAKVKLVGVQLKVHTRGIAILDDGELALENTVVTAVDMESNGFGIGIGGDNVVAKVSLFKSSVTGFKQNAQGYGIVAFGVSRAPRFSLSVDQSTLSSNAVGIFVNYMSRMTLTGTSLGVIANERGGLRCEGACTIDLTGSTFSGNGSSADPTAAFFGAIWLGATNVAYELKLRKTNVGLTKNLAGVANANVENNSGLFLAGDATSTFDLGTAASPGQNMFVNNSSGVNSANVTVKVDPAVVVSSVGNQFEANVQGANAMGRYVLGAAPCGASTCDVTSGTGTNYRVGSGTLRLAE